jgi:hypothetical protein
MNLEGGFQAPILTDAAWAKIAKPDEALCMACFLSRADGIRLVDLLPCPFNLFGSPSWFDLFLSLEKDEPVNMAEWRKARASRTPARPPQALRRRCREL